MFSQTRTAPCSSTAPTRMGFMEANLRLSGAAVYICYGGTTHVTRCVQQRTRMPQGWRPPSHAACQCLGCIDLLECPRSRSVSLHRTNTCACRQLGPLPAADPAAAGAWPSAADAVSCAGRRAALLFAAAAVLSPAAAASVAPPPAPGLAGRIGGMLPVPLPMPLGGPTPVGFPRKSLDLRFAVLLMRR